MALAIPDLRSTLERVGSSREYQELLKDFNHQMPKDREGTLKSRRVLRLMNVALQGDLRRSEYMHFRRYTPAEVRTPVVLCLRMIEEAKSDAGASAVSRARAKVLHLQYEDRLEKIRRQLVAHPEYGDYLELLKDAQKGDLSEDNLTDYDRQILMGAPERIRLIAEECRCILRRCSDDPRVASAYELDVQAGNIPGYDALPFSADGIRPVEVYRQSVIDEGVAALRLQYEAQLERILWMALASGNDEWYECLHVLNNIRWRNLLDKNAISQEERDILMAAPVEIGEMVRECQSILRSIAGDSRMAASYAAAIAKDNTPEYNDLNAPAYAEQFPIFRMPPSSEKLPLQQDMPVRDPGAFTASKAINRPARPSRFAPHADPMQPQPRTVYHPSSRATTTFKAPASSQ